VPVTVKLPPTVRLPVSTSLLVIRAPLIVRPLATTKLPDIVPPVDGNAPRFVKAPLAVVAPVPPPVIGVPAPAATLLR